MAVADIDKDGIPNLVAVDARGNMVAFRPDGTELWERHLASLLAQAPLCQGGRVSSVTVIGFRMLGL